MKKIIGLCVNQISNGENYQRIKCLYQVAAERDISMIVFPVGTELNAVHDKDYAKSFYWLESKHLDILLIDAQGINNKEYIRALANRAQENRIPSIVLNEIMDDVPCIYTMEYDGFADMLGHLIATHGCRKFAFIGGVMENGWDAASTLKHNNKLSEVMVHTMKNHHLAQNIVLMRPDVEKKAEVKNCIIEMLKQQLPDAIVCGNDTSAVIVCECLKVNGISIPDQVKVTGMGGSIRGSYYQPMITGCGQDYETFGNAVFDLADDLMQGKNVTEPVVIAPSVQLRESCGCHTQIREDSAEIFNWMYDTILFNEQYEKYLFDFTEEFLNTVTIDEISHLLLKTMNKDTIVCVRDSFMQDIFTENNVIPDKNEKFYVLADTRENAKTWESFQLYELFPGLAENMAQDRLHFIIPINYQKSFYGYVIFCPIRKADRMFGIEKFVRNLNSTLGRYINEKKLRFANHELICANENVKRMQVRDVLTGLLNSNGFTQKMESMIQNCLQNNEKIMVFCIDLDRLANINEIFGHAEGDVAIQTIAHLIQETMKEKSIAARLGSDEFVVAVSASSDEDPYVKNYEKILLGKVENYNCGSGKDYTIEINYSQLLFAPTPEIQVKDILDEAFSQKRMLKENKRSRQPGRRFRGEEEISKEEHDSVTEVLDKNEFVYAFQPIVSAKNGAIVAYEALMRTSQERKLTPISILKCAFIDNRLYDIERLTLQNVMKLVKENRNFLGERKVFINSIPSDQLNDEDFYKLKRKYAQIMPHVVIEITEQTELDAKGIEILRKRSAEAGFEVAIDDFGTGYSNTASLLRYLPNYVKIDRALIENMDTDQKKQHFIANIVEFAHDNGFLALAEGVETSAELSASIKKGVDLIQGYYTARPCMEFIDDISPSIIEEIIRANLDGRESMRKKIYVVNKEQSIFLMQLATAQYTGIVVAQNDLKILGNSDFVAGVSIKIKENTATRLTISNVRLCSEYELPCIDIGKNASLTLVLEGDNELYDHGIRVPEGSSLKVEGSGNLSLISDSIDTYGIGNDVSKGFGTITFELDGKLNMNIAGKHCISIGGGYSSDQEGIVFKKGRYNFQISGLNCLAVGNMSGNVPIRFDGSDVTIDIQSASGGGIGSRSGKQNITIKDSKISMQESGNVVCGFGTSEGCSGSFMIENSEILLDVDGRKAIFIGGDSGNPSIKCINSKLKLTGHATHLLGIGSFSKNSNIELNQTEVTMDINSNDFVPFGAEEKQQKMDKKLLKIKNE